MRLGRGTLVLTYAYGVYEVITTRVDMSHEDHVVAHLWRYLPGEDNRIDEGGEGEARFSVRNGPVEVRDSNGDTLACDQDA